MSIWGSGPFEDDASLDYLGEFADLLLRRVDALLLPSPTSIRVLYPAHSILTLISLLQTNAGWSGLTRDRVQLWQNSVEKLLSESDKRQWAELEHELAAKLQASLQTLFNSALLASPSTEGPNLDV